MRAAGMTNGSMSHCMSDKPMSSEHSITRNGVKQRTGTCEAANKSGSTRSSFHAQASQSRRQRRMLMMVPVVADRKHEFKRKLQFIEDSIGIGKTKHLRKHSLITSDDQVQSVKPMVDFHETRR